MAILEGTAYWASITTPNTTFEPVYTVNLVVDDETANEVLVMISHVSASKNGNRVPECAKSEPEMLWPRFCDRLEAIGFIGALRCY